MRTALRRCLNRVRREEGLTLIEMLVASAMSVVLVGAVSSMIVGVMRSQPEISERAQNVSTARWVLERMTREVRNGIRIDQASASKVSLLTYVRRTTCGGTTLPASSAPAIKCQVTYQCTTASCSRIEAKEGVYTGTSTTIFTGINDANVFCYVPSAGADPLACGTAGSPVQGTTYVGIRLHIPNPSGPSGITVSDAASLRNATLAN